MRRARNSFEGVRPGRPTLWSRGQSWTGPKGPRANLALEEALLRGNDGLLLRLWGNERSVIIGRAQFARFETDVERCAREGFR